MSIIELIAAEPVELTVEESRAQMETLINDRLGISREEFLARLDNGYYADTEDTETLHLVTLAPFAR